MKKLFIAMICFASIFLTSSCTADSPVETKNENSITPTKVSDTGTGISADDPSTPEPTPGPIKPIDR